MLSPVHMRPNVSRVLSIMCSSSYLRINLCRPFFIPITNFRSVLAATRVVRDRSAYEKSRQAKQKRVEYWRSTVPSPNSLGLEEIDSDEVFDEIQKRVRREAKYLCLFPSETFSEPNATGDSSQPKRYNEWLLDATTLITASLNLDSPNPIGWEPHEESFVLSKLQNGEWPSYWILGVFCRLRGAQPWQATRSYIATKIYELLEVSIFLCAIIPLPSLLI